MTGERLGPYVIDRELGTGRSPFDAEDVPQVVRKVLHETPQRLGELNPQLSAYFEEVVLCLLRKDRTERFSTAEELLEVLEAGVAGPWWRERAHTLRGATRRPLRRIRIPRETSVYGREDELTRLRALSEGARAGDGRVLLLEGEEMAVTLAGLIQPSAVHVDVTCAGVCAGLGPTLAGLPGQTQRELQRGEIDALVRSGAGPHE